MDEGEVETFEYETVAFIMWDPSVSETEGSYLKGISFSPAFHISHFCSPSIFLEGALC